MSKIQKEFRLNQEDLAKLLRDIAEALENENQLNLDFDEEKLIQPLGGETAMSVYQDENGTEFGFKLKGKED